MIGVWVLLVVVCAVTAFASWRLQLARRYRNKPVPRHYKRGGNDHGKAGVRRR